MTFEAWRNDLVAGNAFDRRITAGPAGLRQAHPSLEHLAILIVAWAAGGSERPGRRFAQGFTYGNLGMNCDACGA